ncbi:hypothetical protein MRB53_028721 [Persea americana]|uniref:Uncharacterized protein n=1 Tax=Persea americana TaxID=3435 RepID=A0ACC2KGT4_PERAE|nr:hypothetical protein MRB53_028721 [Persea americana]
MAVEGVVGFLLTKLDSFISKNVNLLTGVKIEVQEMKSELESIKAFLASAPDSSIEEAVVDEQLQLWIKNVRDVAYNIEDVLDEFTLEQENDALNEVQKMTKRSNLLEIVHIVIGIRRLFDEEIAVKKRDLVELLLIDPIIHHLVRFPTLSRDEGLALHHLYVVAGAGGGGCPAGGEEEAVLLDVVVLAVKLFGLVFVHVVVVRVSGFHIVVIGPNPKIVPLLLLLVDASAAD